MRILVTSSPLQNLSGVATLVEGIMRKDRSGNVYYFFQVGSVIDTKKRLSWLAEQLSLPARLIWTVLRNRIDIVHLNAPFEKPALLRDFLIFIISKLLLTRKIIFHVHGGILLRDRPSTASLFHYLIKIMLRYSDGNIVLSTLEHAHIYNRYQVDCFVLPNALGHVAVYPANKDFKGKLTFIYLGRIVEEKGVFLVSEAFASMGQHFDKFQFLIYGSGPDLDRFLQSLSKVEGLNYTYKGVARYEEKDKALQDAHIFLLPSLFEGLPLAMLEAMSFGCIPVVSDAGSIPEVVTHKNNGFVIRSNSKEQLAEVIAEIIEDKNVLPAMSRSAHGCVLKHHSMDGYLDQLHRVYNRTASLRT